MVDVTTTGHASAHAAWCSKGLATTVSTCGQLLGTPVPVGISASRPIAEVAFRVGFAEPATLSKMVYRLSGRTPSYYRSLQRGTPGNA